MSGKFFLDTNIFVYSFDTTSKTKLERSLALIREAISTKKGLISFQVVQEFFNVALRKFDPAFTAAEAEQYLSIVFRPLLAVHSSPALYIEALRISGKHRMSWYDSLLIAAALESRCEILYSEDLQHGQRFGQLQVVNPFV
jgi:predicted nucleic acid-binding protein